MNRQENFPLTFGLMKNLHYENTPKIKEGTWLKRTKMAAPLRDRRHKNCCIMGMSVLQEIYG